MSANAEAHVVRSHVVCSRCGAMMTAEEIWISDHPDVPLMLWRCETGHITQALPLPDTLRPYLVQRKPRLSSV